MIKHPMRYGFTPHVLSGFGALMPNLLGPADGDAGSDMLIGGGDWASQGFIGEAEQSALGIHDPLKEGPVIFGMDPVDKETDEDEDKKPEDDDKKPEDEDDVEDEEDDDEEEEEDDAEDDDAEDDDDEEEEDADKKPKADDKKPDTDTAKQVRGLQREVVRQRARAREAEDNLREVTTKLAAAREKEAKELPTLKAEMRQQMVALNKARIDEDVEAMTDAEEALEELRRKVARIDGAAERLADSQERASKAVTGVVLELANAAIAEYPILDEKSKSFDLDVVTMVNAIYTENAAKMNAADAFGDAVERVMKKLGQTPKGSAAKPKKDAAKKDAVDKRRAAAESTPRTPTKGDKKLGGDYTYNASDFETSKGRAKLQKQLGIVLPK